MTPKQRYDDRKRLKAERLHRQEAGYKCRRDKEDDSEARMESLISSIERIADIMELWADQQVGPAA